MSRLLIYFKLMIRIYSGIALSKISIGMYNCPVYAYSTEKECRVWIFLR